MIKCPNCNAETISRWRGISTCSKCGAVVRDSYLFRVVCVPLPMTCAAIVMNTWFPDIGVFWFMMVIITTLLGGFALNLLFPRLKVVALRSEEIAQP